MGKQFVPKSLFTHGKEKIYSQECMMTSFFITEGQEEHVTAKNLKQTETSVCT